MDSYARLKSWIGKIGSSNWLVARWRTFYLLPKYLHAVIHHWNDILWGSLPTFPFVIWAFLGSPPWWLKAVVFVWVLVIAGYYAWRRERQSATAPSGPQPALYGSMAGGLGRSGDGIVAVLRVTIWNRGNMPSIVNNWQLGAACGEKSAIIFDATLDPSTEADLQAPSRRTKISTESGIPPGGEARYKLTYRLPFSLDEMKENELQLALTFFDVMDRPSTLCQSFQL